MNRRSFLRASTFGGGALLSHFITRRSVCYASVVPFDEPGISSVVIKSGAARIYAQTSGDGQPIVLLHANIADSRMWREQVRSLSRQYQVITFDRRGFGQTAGVDEPYDQTADLFAVLDQLVSKNKRVFLVGCSQGGSIAIDGALADSSRFAAMALFSSSVNGSPIPTPIDAVRRLTEAIASAEKSKDIEAALKLKAALFLDGALSNEGRVQGSPRKLFFEMNQILMASPTIGKVRQDQSAWDRLGEIPIPAHVFCGSLDIPHIQARSETIAAKFSNGHFTRISDTAHLPSLDVPNIVTSHLQAILQKL